MGSSHTLSARVQRRLRRLLTPRSRAVEARLRELEAEVQEHRRLHRRVAEISDVVTELLVPLAEGDKDHAQAVLKRYRSTI
jgi:hypothetical protein